MIQTFTDSEQLSKAAAELFIRTAREAVQDRGKFTVALTGGSSPVQLYELLAQPSYREQIPWEQTFVFWGDERWVPLTDERSNFKLALDTFLKQVHVLEEQIFPMWADQEPEEFARKYEETVRKHTAQAAQGFDLILLGMGDDGHTASLFPDTAVLQEKEHWVQAYYLAQQDMFRITLTVPCINRARKVVFLTFGEKKADALYEVLEGERKPEKYPAQLIQPQDGELLWFVDQAAAQLLSGKN